MFRLTLVLSSAIFLIFVIGGRDTGQMRQGLMTKPRVAALAAAPPPPVIVQAPRDMVARSAPEREVQVRAEATPTPTPPTEPALPIAYVNASSVNVRQGPSTQDAVVGRLGRGESALVVWADDTGWSRIRIEGDGVEGYVATRYLTGMPSALAY